MTETGLVEHPAQCDCPQRAVGLHDHVCPTIAQYMDENHDARDRADYEEMHRDDVRWEGLLERERALERQLLLMEGELRLALEQYAALKAECERAYASLAEGDKRYAVENARQRKVILELKERLSAAESKEVCAVAHDDCVLGIGESNFCPYCEIERLINEGEDMRQVRLRLYDERDYARQAARTADARLIAAHELLSLCRSSVERDGRPHIVARIDEWLTEPQS